MKATALLLIVCLFGTAYAQDECHEPDVDQVAGEASLAADVCAMNDALGTSPPDFVTALSIYTVGQNVLEETLEEAALKEFPCPTWEKYEDFFGGAGWMDTIIKDALAGEGPFVADQSRVQVVKKLLQGTVLNQHAIYHLEKAILELEEPDAEEAVFQWDLAMAAFFGADVDCAGFGNGVARGIEFGTTIGALAGTNVKIGQQFKTGREAIDEEDVKGLTAAVEEIKRNIAIIYVQSVLKYAVLVSEATEAGEPIEKAQGEGYGYLHAILPLVADCSEDVANAAVDVLTPGNEPEADAALEIVDAMAGIFECLDITEEEVGAFRAGEGVDLSEFEATCFSLNPFASFTSVTVADADG